MKFRLTIIITLLLLAGCARFQPRPISPVETAASLESRTLNDPKFREFLEKSLGHRLDTWPLKSWDFDTLYLAALYYQPSLDVARAQWKVAQGGEVTAGERPNPTLSVVPGYDFNSTGLSPWLPVITLDVPLETAGKRGFREAQARHLSESARFDIAAAAWLVRSNLRTALIDLTAARQREELLQNQLTIQRKIVHGLEQQLQSGEVSSSDVMLVQIARNRMQLELTDAQLQRADARVRVADSMGLPVKSLEGIELVYELSAPPGTANELTSAQVREQALTNRADVLSALSDYAASQSALQLEIARQFPDVHLGPGYQFDHGEHTFILSLTADLPLLNRNQGPIAEAKARRGEMAARFTALQAKVITEIDRAVAAYRVTRQNLSTLEQLSAVQRKQNEVVRAQLNAGAVSQLDFMNSEIELGASELVQLDVRIKLQQSFGALEDAVQRPLDVMKLSLIEPDRVQAMKENKP